MGERLIGKSELLTMVPFTIQHIYRLEKVGQFPRRVQVGQHRVAWVQSEIEAYIAVRIAQRSVRPSTAEQHPCP